METNTLRRMLVWLVCVTGFATGLQVNAASGYMAFLANGPTGTAVTTGDAASYMRAGADWDGATLVTGVAVPTLLQASTINSWNDGAAIRFRFVIPDRTTTSGSATSSTLVCGDQVIVQVGPPNSAATSLQVGQHFRFEVVIQDSLISGGAVKKRLPNPVGHPQAGRWKSAAEAATAATATLTAGGNQYTIDLTIPFAEFNKAAGDIGLALAIVNDLGHSHGGSPGINEASGTAFPVGMGMTPESDPGLTCGAPTTPLAETATGNWTNPSTWGLGYFSVASVPLDVTLDQGPAFVLSRAIRLGRCAVLNFADIAEVTTANWSAIQQNVANNWYLHNPAAPCKMTIWINAQVSGTGIVRRRFLAVWGRPGISPQDWYFAGMTGPVAINAPTTAVSFIWNNPPAVTFSNHPCLRVYVLPETLTAAQQAVIDNLKIPATATGSNLAVFESTFGVAQGSTKSAQMNFNNIGTGSCTDAACLPSTAAIESPLLPTASSFSLIGASYAQDASSGRRGEAKPGDAKQPTRPTDDKRSNLVRVIAHGFGLVVPQGTKPYAYVEHIGGLGWAIPANRLNDNMVLDLEVANPRFTEKMFVNGNPVEIPSLDRRILVATVVSVTSGTPVPVLDLSSLDKFAQTPVKPGEVFKAQIHVKPAGHPSISAVWWWLLALLGVVLVAYLLLRRSRP